MSIASANALLFCKISALFCIPRITGRVDAHSLSLYMTVSFLRMLASYDTYDILGIQEAISSQEMHLPNSQNRITAVMDKENQIHTASNY